jgi:hypothetical protein
VGTLIFETVTGEGIVELVAVGGELVASRLSYVQDFASVIKFVDESGYYPRRWEVVLLPVLTFIPRTVWPDKPIFDFGYWMNTEVLGGTTRAANTATTPGSFYVFFGPVGYLVAMFLLGVLQAFAYQRYARGQSLAALFFAPFLAVALVHPEQDIFSVSGVIQQLLIMAIIARIVFTKRGPDSLQGFAEDPLRSKALNFTR